MGAPRQQHSKGNDPMSPYDAAKHYLALARQNEGAAMAFAIRYEESLCASESDFDLYLILIEGGE